MRASLLLSSTQQCISVILREAAKQTLGPRDKITIRLTFILLLLLTSGMECCIRALHATTANDQKKEHATTAAPAKLLWQLLLAPYWARQRELVMSQKTPHPAARTR